MSGGSWAQIRNSSTVSAQSVTAQGIFLQGGTAGINNQAAIFTASGQNIEVGAGGITALGGAGTVGNHAGIRGISPTFRR